MKASGFRYLIKEGVRSLWTNRVMSLTSVGVLTTCLLIVGAAYLLTINVDSMVRFIESQNQMSAFATLDTSEERLAELEKEIASLPNVASVEMVSPQEGLDRYIDDENLAYLLQDYVNSPDSPIPTTYKISVKDIARTRETQAEVAAIIGIESVEASNSMADTLTGLRDVVTTAGSMIILALGIISLVIITNTIRATIFTRRKEVSIMRYVGATNTFIRVPFLVEGFFLGLISAVLAYLLIWGCYAWLVGLMTAGTTTFLQSMFESVVPFRAIAGNLALFFCVSGTLLGTVGSVISLRNHAKA